MDLQAKEKSLKPNTKRYSTSYFLTAVRKSVMEIFVAVGVGRATPTFLSDKNANKHPRPYML